MKTLYSESYYRQNWGRFIKVVSGKHYRNLEAELQHQMSIYKELPQEAINLLVKIEAQKIANSCETLVLEEKQTLKDLEDGKASLGYTTRNQEIQAKSELHQRFEFNCLQLADFKKKYLA